MHIGLCGLPDAGFVVRRHCSQPDLELAAGLR